MSAKRLSRAGRDRRIRGAVLDQVRQERSNPCRREPFRRAEEIVEEPPSILLEEARLLGLRISREIGHERVRADQVEVLPLPAHPPIPLELSFTNPYLRSHLEIPASDLFLELAPE